MSTERSDEPSATTPQLLPRSEWSDEIVAAFDDLVASAGAVLSRYHGGSDDAPTEVVRRTA